MFEPEKAVTLRNGTALGYRSVKKAYLQPMPQLDLNTKIYLPNWWIHSFEWTASVRSRFLSPAELIEESRLSPACHLVELEALASILNASQIQILAGKSRVRIKSDDHSKRGPYSTLNQKFVFDRLLQILSSFGIICPADELSHKIVPIFASAFLSKQSVTDKTEFTLELSDSGAELIFGLINPYADLLRLSSNTTTLDRLIGGKPPLKMWRSIWLDMHPVERSLLMRIEQAQQWDAHFLSFDGTFGLGLGRLFQDLDLPGSRRKGQSKTPYALKARILEKFGKKLREHGYLRPGFEADILPAAKVGELTLLWQVSSQYLADISLREYCLAAWQKVFSKQLTSQLRQLTALILGDTTNQAQLDYFHQLWQDLAALEQDDKVMIVDGNYIYSRKALFWEWSVRESSLHDLQLVRRDQYRDWYRWVEPSADSTLAQRYAQFSEYLDHEIDFPETLMKVSGLSIATLVSRSNSQTFTYLASRRSPPAKSKFTAGAADRSRSHTALVEPLPEASLVDDRERPDASLTSAPMEIRTGLLSKTDALAEIERLRHYDKDKYEKLKASYIDTLDSEKRSIILEVKQRLQPKIFDDHLRNSLAKFIVENPDRLTARATR